MRLYDIVALVTPDLNDEDAQKVASEYRKILSDGGAEIVKDETWGRRRLAFPILRKREAYYHYFQVSAEPAVIAEKRRRLEPSRHVCRRRKGCKFCGEKLEYVGWKAVKRLQGFIPERGKILPRRISGACALHQRKLQTAIKRARSIALLPYATD